MGKLSGEQIEEYFARHLPYRTRILVAHYLMTSKPWQGDQAQLAAAFEASLITGRMYLNILGVSRNKRDTLVQFTGKDDDVTAADLGGTFVDIEALTSEDRSLLVGFLKMADKAPAHLTVPMSHPVENTHLDSTGRVFDVSVDRTAS